MCSCCSENAEITKDPEHHRSKTQVDTVRKIHGPVSLRCIRSNDQVGRVTKSVLDHSRDNLSDPSMGIGRVKRTLQ